MVKKLSFAFIGVGCATAFAGIVFFGKAGNFNWIIPETGLGLILVGIIDYFASR